MIFASPLFIFYFLPIFISLYYITPATGQWRNLTALLGSIVFYSWGEPILVFFILASSVVDYVLVQFLRKDSGKSLHVRKTLLGLSIAFNLLSLGYFKYTLFFLSELNPLLSYLTGHPLSVESIPFPLGISFITFHKLSFVFDNFSGRTRAPRNFTDYLLYILLFPWLIAGPIVRYHDIGDQIVERSHTSEKFVRGFMRFIIGLSKKILIADPLGAMADAVFATPVEALPPGYAWIGILSYTMQIYFDFSGYSDMAIGLGRMMGFEFPENFNRPYISRSITEFWRRWHITLSKWMRLYLYIPLGGNQVHPARIYMNLWIVFVLSGLWHGASWNFIVWGAFHGFFLTIEKMTEKYGGIGFPNVVCQAWTFLIVMIGWVFFRAESLPKAMGFLGAMFGFNDYSQALVVPWGWLFDVRGLVLLVIALAISILPVPERLLDRLKYLFSGDATGVPRRGASVAQVVGFVLIMLLAITTVAAMVTYGYHPFIYYQF